MASGRQFQSAIVFGKNENLKMSLFAYGTRNLNWWLPLVRLSKCWIKYSQPSISIRPWASLYISVNLDCLLLVSSVAHPKSLIISVTLACLLQFCGQNWAALRRTLSRALMSSLKMSKTGFKPHLLIPASVAPGMDMQFPLHSLDNFKGCVVLYPAMCLL